MLEWINTSAFTEEFWHTSTFQVVISLKFQACTQSWCSWGDTGVLLMRRLTAGNRDDFLVFQCHEVEQWFSGCMFAGLLNIVCRPTSSGMGGKKKAE